MKNIIATWVCIDDETNGTYFPSAKGNSSDLATQEIYWRCVCTFFWNARFYNPQAELALFSNQEQLPNVDTVSVGDVLKHLGVQYYTTPFEYVTPAGYYGEWRNQFYEFSIFNFISEHAAFNDADNFLLLDSDCVITADLFPLFESVKEHKCITYLIDYSVEQKINGNSREDMKKVFEELLNKKLELIPDYHGGEFYASTITMVKHIIADFKLLWPQLIIRHLSGLDKLNEEAHVLSYLFFKNGIKGGEANGYIKRLWTDPSTFRNIEATDVRLFIWHLPAEKRTGFRKMFSWLRELNFDGKAVDKIDLQRRIEKIFMVPEIPPFRKPYFITKSLVKRMIS